MSLFFQSDLDPGSWSQGTSQSSWGSDDLWEKIEQRIQKKRYFWVLLTLLFFLILSAVPIVLDQRLRWETRELGRKLAQEINWMRWKAGTQRSAILLRVSAESPFSFQLESLSDCAAYGSLAASQSSLLSQSFGRLLREGQLVSEKRTGPALELLSAQEGLDLGIPGIVHAFCYDYLKGNYAALDGLPVVGFGFIAKSDLLLKKTNRMSLILISGASAQVSFD